MKTNFLKGLALAAVLALAPSTAGAQRGYTVPELSAELKTMADQVNEQIYSDPEAANKLFTKLQKKVKNNKENLLAVGQYFLDGENLQCARLCAKDLYVLAPTYVDALMFEGEVFMKFKQYGEAGGRYDEVLALQPQNVNALMRNAWVYKNVNPYVAVESLEKIKEIDPGNVDADKQLGDIQMGMKEFKKASEHYAAYFQNVQPDAIDVHACDDYLTALFLTGDFEKLGELAPKFMPLDEKDMILKRYNFFAKYEAAQLAIDMQAALATAKEAMGYIDNKEFDDSLYLDLDYIYAAQLSKDMEQYPEAVAYYAKALEKSPDNLTALKDMATVENQHGDAEKGLALYKQYLEKKGDKAELSDVRRLGRMYIALTKKAGNTPEQRDAYIAEGDKAFERILTEFPNLYQIVIDRATLHITNPQAPEEAPKGYFEQALGMMDEQQCDATADPYRLTAYRYLAIYYFLKDDKAGALDNAKKVLAIDPDDNLGKQISEVLK